MNVTSETQGQVTTVTITRPQRRNAVDADTADALAAAFRVFENDDDARVAVLTGAGGNFCAGFDLQAMETDSARRLNTNGEGPMGPTRMRLSKPVIAAVEGYAVAGGLELALWCDLRVAAESAVFGVFCRRFGVPLIDGGTVRLPRLIGTSRAMDMILTGRPVPAREALGMGLANRLAADGAACEQAQALAEQIAQFPQTCMLSDRASAYQNGFAPLEQALESEHRFGLGVVNSGETLAGARLFASGLGRHGDFSDLDDTN